MRSMRKLSNVEQVLVSNACASLSVLNSESDVRQTLSNVGREFLSGSPVFVGLPHHLNQEELDFFNDESVHLTRCWDGVQRGCGHLSVFHVYVGGDNECIICGCRS